MAKITLDEADPMWVHASSVQAAGLTDWDPDLHPRGSDGKFIDVGISLSDLLDELPDAASTYLDRKDIDPRVPERPSLEELNEARNDWKEARDDLKALIDEHGQDEAFSIIEVLAKRRDTMRKAQRGEIGPDADFEPDRPDPPDPTEPLDVETISEQWDGEIPDEIPDDLGIMYGAAQAAEDYRQFRETITQQGMMDISNRELDRFGRAFSGDPDFPHRNIGELDDSELGNIQISDAATAQAIQEAREGDGQITLYRAVPEGVENIDVGDYVALNRDYVERHAQNVLEGQQDEASRIIEEQVALEDVVWPGEAVDEFVFSPQEYRDQFPDTRTFFEEATDAADAAGSITQADSAQEALRERFPDLDVNVLERDDSMVLERVVVPEDQRGEGTGSQFMEDLTEYADAKGKTISLDPATDFGATSEERLIQFYQRFGFVLNEGQNKDFAISERMYRLPEGG